MITKEAEDKKANNYDIVFCSSARTGFEHLLRSLKLGRKKILMPAYIGETDTDGSGVFEPIRNTRTAYDFYSVSRKLVPNMDEIEKKLKTGNYGALFIIHYFGFSQCDPAEARALCDKFGVIFIEDCAHTWCSKSNQRKLGTFGHFSLFSIHKLVAAKGGGFLLKNKEFNMEPLDQSKKISPDDMQLFFTSNWEKINKIRLRNYNYLLDALRNEKLIEIMYPKLEQGIIPLNFPILFKKNLREKVYFRMIKKGVITIALYYRLIPEIPVSKFPVSVEISNSILNLPVHQDITPEDLKKTVNALKESLKELG
ncbi:DegT/DnrJ/EryC1/StrS aminotransferase family protein [Candidatus Woesearchaeota archaeon]|nr:DegT/DnrJ/EryC1/StrS aminotransferase family protein [Candidatus Woesearchaeota archaeon]